MRVRSRRLLSRLDRSGSRPDRSRPGKKVDRSVSTGILITMCILWTDTGTLELILYNREQVDSALEGLLDLDVCNTPLILDTSQPKKKSKKSKKDKKEKKSKKDKKEKKEKKHHHHHKKHSLSCVDSGQHSDHADKGGDEEGNAQKDPAQQDPEPTGQQQMESTGQGPSTATVDSKGHSSTTETTSVPVIDLTQIQDTGAELYSFLSMKEYIEVVTYLHPFNLSIEASE